MCYYSSVWLQTVDQPRKQAILDIGIAMVKLSVYSERKDNSCFDKQLYTLKYYFVGVSSWVLPCQKHPKIIENNIEIGCMGLIVATRAIFPRGKK